MKTCATVWNYRGNRFDDAYRLHQLGFDAVSWLGSEFDQMNEEDDQRLVAMLKETGMELTIHGRLPDPADLEMCESFHKAVKRTAAWQQKYVLLYSWTFDFWTEQEKTLPYLEEVLCAFRGTNTVIAAEDIPLNKIQMKGFEKIIHPKDRFGILIDVGHMNIRQRCIELVEAEDFVAAFQALPLPVIEVHLHDNLSYKDDHMYFGYGNLPLDAIVTGLKKVGFNGFSTIEIVSHGRGWSEEETFTHTVNSRDLFLNRWNEVQI